MKSLYIIIAIVITALAGTLVGGYGGMVMTHKRVDRIAGHAPERILRHMTSQLDLSQKQRSALDKIVFNVHTQIVTLHEAFTPQIETAMEGAFDQIGTILSKEQMAQLEKEIKIFEQHQDEIKHSRHPSGPRMSPPPPRGEDAANHFDNRPPPQRDFGMYPPKRNGELESPTTIISNLIMRLEQLQAEDIPDNQKMQKMQMLLRPPRDQHRPPGAPMDRPMDDDMPSEGPRDF